MTTINSQSEYHFKRKINGLDYTDFKRSTNKGFYIRFRKDGVSQSVTVPDFKTAKLEQQKFLRDNPSSYYSAKVTNETLNDYAENYLRELNKITERKNLTSATRTKQNRANPISYFLAEFGNMKVKDLNKKLTEENFRDWHYKKYSIEKNYYGNPFSRRVAQEHFNKIKSFLKWVIEHDNNHLQKHSVLNLTEGFITYGLDSDDPDFILRESALDIYKQMRDDLNKEFENPHTVKTFIKGQGHIDKPSHKNHFKYGLMAVIYLQLATGVRISEGFGIRWKDIVKKNDRYYVEVSGQQIKSDTWVNQVKHRRPGQKRPIPITKNIYKTILGFKDYQYQMAKLENTRIEFENVCGFTSYSSRNAEYKPNQRYYHNIWKQPTADKKRSAPEHRNWLLSYDCFNQGLDFHRFRHGYALSFIRDTKGNEMHVLKAILGHKTDKTVNWYTNIARNNGLIPELVDSYLELMENKL